MLILVDVINDNMLFKLNAVILNQTCSLVECLAG